MMRKKNGIVSAGENKTLDVKYFRDSNTGKEFSVDRYPSNQRTSDSAKYAVSEKYGSFIGKVKTLKAAKNLIREQRKIRRVS